MRLFTLKFFSHPLFIAVVLALAACKPIPTSTASSSTPSPEPMSSPSPVVQETPRPFDPKLDIGLVVVGSECSELFIRNKELKPDDEIQVVLADDVPRKKLIARVVGPNKCPRYSHSGIEEVVLDGDDSAPTEYEVRFADEKETESGFAVISAKANVEIKKGVANLIAHDPATSFVFRVCSGNESLHMTVWDGKPLVGKRVWYSYLRLTYDTVPTCKPADFK